MTKTHETSAGLLDPQPRYSRDEPLLSLEAVAELLGLSQSNLTKKIQRDDSFPAPAVWRGRTRLWSWAQVSDMVDPEVAVTLVPAHVLFDPAAEHTVEYLGVFVDRTVLSYDFLIDGAYLVTYAYPLEVEGAFRHHDDFGRLERYEARGLNAKVAGHWIYVLGEGQRADDVDAVWDVEPGHYWMQAQLFGRGSGESAGAGTMPPGGIKLFSSEQAVAQAYAGRRGVLGELEQVLGMTLPLWPSAWQDVAVMAAWTPDSEPIEIRLESMTKQLVLDAVAAGRADAVLASDIATGASTYQDQTMLESYLELGVWCPLHDDTAEQRLATITGTPFAARPKRAAEKIHPGNIRVVDEPVARALGANLGADTRLELVSPEQASQWELAVERSEVLPAPSLGTSVMGHAVARTIGASAPALSWWVDRDGSRVWLGSLRESGGLPAWSMETAVMRNPLGEPLDVAQVLESPSE